MRFILLFLFLAGCAVWDWRTGKIPNRWLLFWLFLFGVFLLYEGRGKPFAAVFDYLAATVFTGLVLFPLFLFRMTGAGDIKTAAVINGVLGISTGFAVIFYGLAASAAWSLIYMAQKRILLKRIAYFLKYMKNLSRTDQIPPYYDAGRDGTEAAFCFAPFLLLGFCIRMMAEGGIL